MVVIDDPASIIRCTNKVYLKKLLDREQIPCPRSHLIFRKDPTGFDELSESLGATMVVKIPDGSFSVGIAKVSSHQEYEQAITELFQRSSVLLVQEYVPTEFDWRIGVIGGELIYGCKYFMARGHWQIIQHRMTGGSRAGAFETVPINSVPSRVRKLALKATSLVGKGLYGVDIKVVNDQPIIIQINDNPSLEHGVEDKILGNELYRIILREFVDRLNARQHT
jgi:glutathione synthase/RimK-type ligase-like ATP-grasp enzyme